VDQDRGAAGGEAQAMTAAAAWLELLPWSTLDERGR
jgi:hypothetical protein